MAGFKLEKFGGVRPAVGPRALAPHEADIAIGCDVRAGVLRPWRAPIVVDNPTKGGTINSIFKYHQTWFHWNQVVHAVKNPLPNDPYDRVLFTGHGKPQYTTNDAATSGGGTDYPTLSYDLGVRAPSGAPTATLQGTPGDELIVDSREYVVTYVNSLGEEGPPSMPSNRVRVADGQSVQLSGLPGAPGGNTQIDRIRLYRTSTGSEEAGYLFVTELSVGAATYHDTLTTDQLPGGTLVTLDYDPPPEDMHGLCVLSGGFLAGLAGNELCFSEPGHPYAWPVAYRYTLPAEGIALLPVTQGVVAVTSHGALLFTGVDPQAMSRQQSSDRPIAGARAGISLEGAAVYATVDGLVAVDSSGASRVVSEGHFSRDQWEQLRPDTFRAVAYEGRYIAFNDSPGQHALVYDPYNEFAPFSFLDLNATAGHYDPDTKALYLLVGSQIVRWDAGEPTPYRWRSGRGVTPTATSMGVARVIAHDYPITFHLIGDGGVIYTTTVSNEAPFRLPAGRRYHNHQIELEGEHPVFEVTLATTMHEMRTTR